MKKNPNRITEEDLLKLLETKDELSEEIEFAFDSTVLAFMQCFNLNPGKDPIVKKQLYSLYKMWNKGVSKLSKVGFTIEASKYFNHKGNFYFIDKDLFQIADYIQKEDAKKKLNKSKSKYWHSHFNMFLTDLKLEEGYNYIELEIIYFLYCQWRDKKRTKTVLSRLQFIKLLDLFFDVKAISHGSHLWVGVNEQIKNLISKTEVDRWRRTRAKNKKNTYYPQEEWKKFTLYWEENKEKE